jgi:hypothetical protein
MLNPFFLQGSKTEQGLIQSIINEAIQIHGIDVYYIPRQYITKNTVIREVIESHFKNAYPIEAYVDTYEGYEGAGVLLSKFGIKPSTDMSLIISKERYETYIAPLIQNIPKIELSSRPKEGDLIWFPLGDRLFEIKFVEHEVPFYQLQKNYVYNLRCELFRYQDEVIDTGIDQIDDNIDNVGYVQVYNMVGAGVTASASTVIVNGGVRFVTITNRGDGYKTAPTVAFSTAPFGGVTATGIATMIGGIVDLCEPDETLLRVQGVELSNPGAGYTVAPTVSFIGGGGRGAQAVATIGDGIIGPITITNGGSGYSSIPNISFVGIASTSAQAVAVLDNGSISQIRITNSGLGYTQAPQIVIDSPFMGGTGTYAYNEEVVGSASSITARVRSWNATTLILQLSNATGEFIPGEIITGTESGASYMIYQEPSLMTIDEKKEEGIITDAFIQNDDIQKAANDIIDFSESNPFGTP